MRTPMRRQFPIDSPLHLFSEEEVTAIFAAGHERRCALDEVVVREGEPGDSMFFVLDGYAGARLDSGAMARSYGPGSYFGELSFINPGHRRSATIVATTALTVQVIDQASIETLVATHPRAIFTLLRRTCAFLVDAERNLVSDLRRRNRELQDTAQTLEHTRNRLSEEEAAARTDALTGLVNRRGFEAELPGFLERAAALEEPLALVALDLDGFKPLNDTAGHAAGDALLRAVGGVLQRSIRERDLACRLGGDEFVVLMPGVEAEAARARAEMLRRLVDAVEQPNAAAGLRVTATLGGAMFRAGDDAEALLQRADQALYAAKRAGRQRVDWAE